MLDLWGDRARDRGRGRSIVVGACSGLLVVEEEQSLNVCNQPAVFQQTCQLWVADAVLRGNLRCVAEAMGLPWADAEGAAMPSLARPPLVLDAGQQAADGPIA